MNNLTFFGLSLIISGVLFFLLALMKNRSKIWWILYGIVECLIVVFISLGISNLTKNIFSIDVDFINKDQLIFVILYVFVYLLFLLFLPKSELSEREKVRIEKINSFIFNIFFAMRHQEYDQAYVYIKNGLKIDPSNPILRQLEKSFDKSEYDYRKARKRLSIKYKIMLFFKNLKKLFGIKSKVNIENDIIDM